MEDIVERFIETQRERLRVSILNQIEDLIHEREDYQKIFKTLSVDHLRYFEVTSNITALTNEISKWSEFAHSLEPDYTEEED